MSPLLSSRHFPFQWQTKRVKKKNKNKNWKNTVLNFNHLTTFNASRKTSGFYLRQLFLNLTWSPSAAPYGCNGRESLLILTSLHNSILMHKHISLIIWSSLIHPRKENILNINHISSSNVIILQHWSWTCIYRCISFLSGLKQGSEWLFS